MTNKKHGRDDWTLLENRVVLAYLDGDDGSAGQGKHVALLCKLVLKTGGDIGPTIFNLGNAMPNIFLDAAEIGKRLIRRKLLGRFRERKNGTFNAVGHDEFHVMIEGNITRLATPDKTFSPAWDAPIANACDICVGEFVAVRTRTHATRKSNRRDAEMRFSKTGCFALKQRLGERHVTHFMLARVLDFATRYGVSRSVAHSTGCV
jgi:hypothetical protein